MSARSASCWSANRMELLGVPHLAWHLSGGTTELLLVEPEGRNVSATRVGGTTDISAGQLIGYVGSTGMSTGAHLHYEMYENGSRIDPQTKYPGMSFTYAYDA